MKLHVQMGCRPLVRALPALGDRRVDHQVGRPVGHQVDRQVDLNQGRVDRQHQYPAVTY